MYIPLCLVSKLLPMTLITEQVSSGFLYLMFRGKTFHIQNRLVFFSLSQFMCFSSFVVVIKFFRNEFLTPDLRRKYEKLLFRKSSELHKRSFHKLE